jgi:transcriptional regulator with XRE-family HTH domain
MGKVIVKEKIRVVLSKNIKQQRARHGWSQMDLADKAHMSNNFVSGIETCRKWPSPEVIECMADAFGIPSTALFAVDTDESQPETSKVSQFAEVVKQKSGEHYQEFLKEVDEIAAAY